MAKSSTSSARGRNPRRGSNGNSNHGLIDDILAMAGSLAGSRKDYAAVKLETLAETVREYTTAMPDIPHVKAYAEAAAESLEELAEYVSDNDVETMLDDARGFARAHPVVTLAGSIAAGLVVTQLMQNRGNASSGRGGSARGSGLNV